MRKLIPIILVTAFMLCSCNQVITDPSVTTTQISETTVVTSSVETTETYIDATKSNIVGLWKNDSEVYEFKNDLTGSYYVNDELSMTFKYELFDGAISITPDSPESTTIFYVAELGDTTLRLTDSFNNLYEFTKIAEPTKETTE